ncbi:MAG: hypothetical protein AB7S26_26345 [Sandaracinaceae bacterium]
MPAAPPIARALARLAVGVCVAFLATEVGGCAQGGGPGDGMDAGSPIVRVDAGGAGACGTAGSACCSGFCNSGLTCDPGSNLCLAASCGAAGQACCDEGPPCMGALTCSAAGTCAMGTMADAGPSCGMNGTACCPTAPQCGAGLVCTASGTCGVAPACGALGQACCSGSMCNSPLVCSAGSCTSGAPMCHSDGTSCSVSSECCNNSCVSGICQIPTGGGCEAHFDCVSCTSDPDCMFCGVCVDYDILGSFVCAVFPDEC